MSQSGSTLFSVTAEYALGYAQKIVVTLLERCYRKAIDFWDSLYVREGPARMESEMSDRKNSEFAATAVTYESLLKVLRITHGQILTEVYREIELADRERQAIENKRADSRNRNRALTLIFALLIGIAVTYTLTHDTFGPFISHTFGPYNFVITIVLDSGLALYAYLRKI